MGESLLPTLFSTLSPQDCWGAPCTPREGSRESQAPQEGPRGTEGTKTTEDNALFCSTKRGRLHRPCLLGARGPPRPGCPQQRKQQPPQTPWSWGGRAPSSATTTWGALNSHRIVTRGQGQSTGWKHTLPTSHRAAQTPRDSRRSCRGGGNRQVCSCCSRTSAARGVCHLCSTSPSTAPTQPALLPPATSFPPWGTCSSPKSQAATAQPPSRRCWSEAPGGTTESRPGKAAPPRALGGRGPQHAERGCPPTSTPEFSRGPAFPARRRRDLTNAAR